MRKTLLFSLYLASATHLLAAGIGFAPAASKITRASKMVAVAGRACTANSIRSYEEIIPPVPSSIVEKIQKRNHAENLFPRTPLQRQKRTKLSSLEKSKTIGYRFDQPKKHRTSR